MGVGDDGEDGAGLAGVTNDLDIEASGKEFGRQWVVGVFGHSEGEVGVGGSVCLGLDFYVEGLKALEGRLDY